MVSFFDALIRGVSFRLTA